MKVYEREDWGAKYGTGWSLRALPAKTAWLHHTDTNAPPEGSSEGDDIAHVRLVELIGRERFRYADFDKDGIEIWKMPLGSGVSYTVMISPSGRIFMGHDPKRFSSHTAGHNADGVGICLLGNLDEDEPTLEHINSAARALNLLVERGILLDNQLDGGHKDVYPTGCPGKAYEYIDLINDIAAGRKPPMARRAPRASDFVALEAELRRRGFEIYCGPSYYKAGRCRPGKHGHSAWSRHFVSPGMAIDFGWPGPPIHDLEALHVELMMEELGRHPTIRYRRLWNLGRGDHDDHGHVDDAYGWSGWIERVTPRPGVRARDGKDLFVSPKAFPNHVPPTNSGYKLKDIVAFQELSPKLMNPATGKPFYGGWVDGYLGPTTRSAVMAIQRHCKITVDGLPGAQTMSALRKAIQDQNKPAPPKPDPKPEPAPEPAPPLDLKFKLVELSGTNAFDTAAKVAAQVESRVVPGKVYIAARDTVDVSVCGQDGVVLLARHGANSAPGATLSALSKMDVKELVFVGGTIPIPQPQRNLMIIAANQ